MSWRSPLKKPPLARPLSLTHLPKSFPRREKLLSIRRDKNLSNNRGTSIFREEKKLGRTSLIWVSGVESLEIKTGSCRRGVVRGLPGMGESISRRCMVLPHPFSPDGYSFQFNSLKYCLTIHEKPTGSVEGGGGLGRALQHRKNSEDGRELITNWNRCIIDLLPPKTPEAFPFINLPRICISSLSSPWSLRTHSRIPFAAVSTVDPGKNTGEINETDNGEAVK